MALPRGSVKLRGPKILWNFLGIWSKKSTFRTPWIRAPAHAMFTPSRCNKEAMTTPATARNLKNCKENLRNCKEMLKKSKEIIWNCKGILYIKNCVGNKKKPHSSRRQLLSCRLCGKCASLLLTRSLGPEPAQNVAKKLKFLLGGTYLTRYEKKEEEKQNERRNCLRHKIYTFIMISSSIANINMITITIVHQHAPMRMTFSAKLKTITAIESTVIIIVDVIAIFAITKWTVSMRAKLKTIGVIVVWPV